MTELWDKTLLEQSSIKPDGEFSLKYTKPAQGVAENLCIAG